MNIGITVANIKGLSRKPYPRKLNCWSLDVDFHDLIFGTLDTRETLYMGKNSKEANVSFGVLKKSLESKSIKDGDKVAIVFDNDNNKLLAISKNCCDIEWIDVRGGFKIKPFKELGIDENSVIMISKA